MRSEFLSRLLLVSLLFVTGCAGTGGAPADRKGTDPYAPYVWPPPPDEPKIRLTAILTGRADVESGSGILGTILGASPQAAYDWLRKPFAVEFDSKGRILVSDDGFAAVVRFDRQGRRMDVFGTSGSLRLKTPLGLAVGSDDTVYVADAALGKVLSFDTAGALRTVYGRAGELVNPTDAAVSPDGKKLFVADSKGQRVVSFELATGKLLGSFGKRGSAEGEFSFPTALAFDRHGNLLVVDQINCRVQVFTASGEFVDQFGGQGVGFGKFVRPKDVAVDREGLIYVTDAAFNNVQIFDSEARLLTFLGEGGSTPGRFQIASGVAVRGDEIAVVDQLGHRVQVFRYIAPRSGPKP